MGKLNLKDFNPAALFKADEITMKLSEYYEVIKPNYIYLQVIPDKSIRNYNTTNIAEAISYTYKKLTEKLTIDTKKLAKIIPIPVHATIKQNYHIAYIVDIKKDNVAFYFQVPDSFKTSLIEKISEIWSKATVNEVEGVEAFSSAATCYQLTYKYADGLSLSVDKKSNEPLNSLLSVIDVMKDDDRVTIVYNFLPRSQKGWQTTCDNSIRDYLAGRNVIREKFSWAYVCRSLMEFIFSVLDTTQTVIADFLGAKPQEGQALIEALATLTDTGKNKELINATRKKKNLKALDTQVAVVSYSGDEARKNSNAVSICQNYNVLNGNNELIYKKSSKIPDLNKFKFSGYDTNSISTDEAQNFLQIPAHSLLKHYNIDYIQAEEYQVPTELSQGYFNLGFTTYKGKKYQAYLEDEYNTGSFPLLLLGPQGMGKTTYMSNIAKYAHSRREGVLLLDFIKKCELSDSVCAVIPAADRVVIDLSLEENLQGFGFNEIKVEESMNEYARVKQANLKAQYTINFIDAINYNEPLTINMRTVLSASCNVVFTLGYSSIKDVVNCLTNHKKRYEFIKALTPGLKSYLEDELEDLKVLDEYDKKGENVVGTKSSKIDFLMARISLLKEDFKLKYMYNTPTDNNFDLFKAMEEGKVVIIKMPQDEFPSKMAKNVLVTYWASKIWAATEMRGKLYEKPHRSHLIIDEPFQAPTVLRLLEYNMPQSRKYGLKTILSTQYINQLGDTFSALIGSNATFMLLKNTNEKDFEALKNITEYQYEDLKGIERFDSLNIVSYSGGYASFITKLPPEIKK